VEIDGCALPEDRRYDLELDVWWAEEPASPGTGKLGLLAPLAAFAGPFRSFAFRPVDGVIGRGRSVATIESTRYTGAIRLPFDATILERNENLPARPRLLNDAPYGDGWVVRVLALAPADASRLETAGAIAERVRRRIAEQHIRCWPQTPDLELYEIGLECSAVLTKLNEELVGQKAGDAVLLVTDDPTSPIEMVRWSDQTGHPVLAHRVEGPIHHFLVRKEAHPVPRRRSPDQGTV
jgi:glycine cleavage system H protein